jgi:DNA-binding transcriptional regulator YhcF (GntR family)
MSAQVLEQLFDSPIKVRMLRLFLRNSEEIFSLPEVSSRIQIRPRTIKKQIDGLVKINFLRKKRIKRKKNTLNKKPGMYFFVNPQFDFYNELRTLVLKSSPASLEKINKYLKRLGRIKLAIISGVFLNNEGSRLDLFIVGDAINTRRLNNFLKNMEAEVGKAIDYSILATDEFTYRFGMFDRFILDILEKPHMKLINKLRI